MLVGRQEEEEAQKPKASFLPFRSSAQGVSSGFASKNSLSNASVF
jgi:hypothetical protein